ncbi:MAG: hypothetical protein PHU23_00180 [Dehalococcoidales bacterium]|nr:hypothetical protein [Dehalococcoidales bacterium]
MCFKWIKSLFIKEPPPEPELELPHPEEPKDDSQTVENVDVDVICTKWLTNWDVPADQRDFWKNKIRITLHETYFVGGIEVPAGTYDCEVGRCMDIEAKWLNPGVIAHEQAHNSYSFLSDAKKAEFSTVYSAVKNTDPMIMLMREKHSYADTNDVEAHAEVYRYIGQEMPAELKEFYPKLF